MKQVLQSYKTGELRLAEVPAPGVEPGALLVMTAASLVSIGTERSTMAIAKKSLIGKAKERPDLVRKLVARASRDGIVTAVEAARRKLDQPIPLGYSCVGRVTEVGDGVSGFAVGMRVACAGAKVANHAEVNLVPQNLCARVPDAVSDEAAAFVTVGAIALQGVRQANPTLGEAVAVIGLGLIGQIAVQLLKANGCRVIGIDLDERKVALARCLGADEAVVRSQGVQDVVDALTARRGVDAVIITAATTSNDPIALAGDLCRDRGRVVAVGAVGMDVPRRPYYDKELTLLQSRSYGPGRYDPVYEEAGVDYPPGYVRWTEQRNMEAFLTLCAEDRIKVDQLISHRFPIAQAEKAYELVGGQADALGILLTYPVEEKSAQRTVAVQPAPPLPRRGTVRIGFIGAGAFAGGTLIPALARQENVRFQCIASARGFSARHLAEQYKFSECTTDADSLFQRPEIDAVVIATRHNLHAKQTMSALRAGRHVFVEKPLALNEEELREVLDAQRMSGKILLVGFNRRFSPLAAELAVFFQDRKGPLTVNYRVNAGPLPADSWIYDPAIGGGRIIGEGCHFIDFASFMTGAPPVEVFARGASSGQARPDENVMVSLSFEDGSIATITYVATGDPAAGKERVEVIGQGACAYLEDYRSLELHRGGKSRFIAKLGQDKGHKAEMKAFVEAVRLGLSSPISPESLAATTRATFAAVQSLAIGRPVQLG